MLLVLKKWRHALAVRHVGLVALTKFPSPAALLRDSNAGELRIRTVPA